MTIGETDRGGALTFAERRLRRDQAQGDLLKYYLGTARAEGSLMELETHLIISERIGLLDSTDIAPLLSLTDEISRMISGLRKALERRL